MSHHDPLEEAFIGDHRRTEEEIKQLKTLVDQDSWEEALERARALRHALQSHIDVEEQWVYPKVDELASGDEDLERTLSILRKRHVEIPAYAEEVISAIEDREAEEAEEAIELLARVIADHHRTEEGDIFPLFMGDGPLKDVAEAAADALRKAHNEEIRA